ncbi:MAG: hypothetical protein IKP47_11225 [Ruminococcus sp.]|nr:hypothetical protein [Ruminococcus sp.]
MVTVYVENGEFKFRGTFDFGYIGFYRDDQIEMVDTCEDIRDEWYDEISEVMDIDTCTDEEIAAFLTDRMNAAEQRIQAHIGEINETFLRHVFDDMASCGNEFWEHEELTVPGFDYDDPDFDFYKMPEEAIKEGHTDFGSLAGPNDGTVKKDSFEQYLRKYKPMFNLDNFLKGIEPECVCLHQDSISFQCSDKYDFAVICGAYDDIDLEDLSFTDWHNY